MEILIVFAFFGYLFYLRNYADLRTPSEKEAAALSDGIALYDAGNFDDASAYFNRRIAEKPKSAIAHLYRGLCHKALGHTYEAKNDIQKAVSLDDSVYKTQLEIGKVYFEEGNFQEALIAFNKAVNLAEGLNAEVYNARARTYNKMNEPELARQDFTTGSTILAAINNKTAVSTKPKAAFVDGKLLASLVMVIFTSALVVFVIKDSESVHLPYLVAVFSAISIGFAEPRKGWLLAIVQCGLIYTGYVLFRAAPENKSQQELENFGLYGSMILTFAASFLGAFLKRALNMK